MSSHPVDWTPVINREAKENNDIDLGEAQEVGQNYVLVERNDQQTEIVHANRHSRML
jgi:hypothetical protein